MAGTLADEARAGTLTTWLWQQTRGVVRDTAYASLILGLLMTMATSMDPESTGRISAAMPDQPSYLVEAAYRGTVASAWFSWIVLVAAVSATLRMGLGLVGAWRWLSRPRNGGGPHDVAA